MRMPRSEAKRFALCACLAAAVAANASPSEPALSNLRDFNLRNLRVWIDFDEDGADSARATFASWPVDAFGAKLPPDQIARGVRLGISVWASVLPDLHFRFAAREADANLIIRFGPYSQARQMGGDGWARAFLPADWAHAARGDCGRFRESRWPDGRPCSEWIENIITFNTGRWTVAGADTASDRRHYEYLSWVFDTAQAHFKPRAGGACRDGKSADAVWSDACVDFARAPHFREIQGVDLAGVVEHEFGHTLVGDHTPPPPGEYAEFNRRPILSADRCVRLGPDGYSILFPGDDEKWWNRRGAFPADIKRLKDMGYRLSYPRTDWTLVLKRADGAILRLHDWSRALDAMIWPHQATPLTRAQEKRAYFLVDVESPQAR